MWVKKWDDPYEIQLIKRKVLETHGVADWRDIS